MKTRILLILLVLTILTVACSLPSFGKKENARPPNAHPRHQHAALLRHRDADHAAAFLRGGRYR